MVRFSSSATFACQIALNAAQSRPDATAARVSQNRPDTHTGVHVQMAREVITSIIARVCTSKPGMYSEIGGNQAHANTCVARVVAAHELDVHLMATGNIACMVVVSSSEMRVSEVKNQALEKVVIPAAELHLFAGDQALREEDRVQSVGDSKLMLVRSAIDPRITNLAHFHCSTDFPNLNHSSFAEVCKIKSGIHGDIFKYRWRCGQSDVCVAVKKIRVRAVQAIQGTETNERAIHLWQSHKKDPDLENAMTEIGVLSFLSKQPDLPIYLLRMQGIFSESQQFTWLVTEFAEGGELFDVAQRGGVSEMQVQTFTWQILQAVELLHRHCIGHRDISLENVLLKDGVVKLMDFGAAVCSHSPSGIPFRYFCQVGKNFYRAPECYVPDCEHVQVIVPFDAAPGDLFFVSALHNFLCEVRLPEDCSPGHSCSAEIWGYAAAPADVFTLGICMFILAFQCPPWQTPNLSNPCFVYVHKSKEHGLESLVQNWGKKFPCPDAMAILKDMLQSNPVRRPSASACLDHSWFSSMAKTPQTLAPPEQQPEVQI